MQVARVRLSSTSYRKLDDLCKHMKSVAEHFGADVRGPIPIPTKKLRITTRKAISGDGTETVEKWQMRVHKRILDISINERALRQIMRVEVPDGVSLEIELKE